jgi:signal transduction histidine kinase/DNA-binding NarL/FixJ family response regulator
MILDFSDLCNILVFGGLIFIAIYHFMIYFNRRDKDRSYNIFFFIFSFITAFFVVITSGTFFKIIPVGNDSVGKIKSILAVFTAMTGIYTSSYFMSIIFEYDRPRKLINLIIFLIAIEFVSMNLIIFTKGYAFYDKYYRPAFSFLVLIFLIVYVSIFFIFIIRNKKYKQKKVIITLSGFAIITLNMGIQRFVEAVKITNPLEDNYIFIGLAAYTFAYSLATIFNEEHIALIDLKNTLEEKVKDRTEELKITNQKLLEENQKRIDFFVNLSHETKTPLMLINGLLNRHIKEEGITQNLKICLQLLNIMTKNVTNFLKSEKLSRNKIDYNNEIYCISNQLKQKAVLFSDISKKKHIKLTYDIEDDVFCNFDISAVDMVFNNVIENAIKYTENDGKIHISLKSENNRMRISIKDSGIGMKPEFLEHIFAPYYQIERSKFNYQGLGMGLFLTKRIIDDLKGIIELKSQEAKGTEVIIILERCIVTEMKEISDMAFTIPVDDNIIDIKLEEKYFNPSKDSVLIVDDQPATLKYLQDLLSDKYNVYLALSGHKAIERLDNIKVDLIISDIMMDYMDGFDFRRIIMMNKDLKRIPFLYLTALDEESEKRKSYNELEINGYITKPFEETDLLYKINDLIKNKKVYDCLLEKVNTEKATSEKFFDKKCDEKNISLKDRKTIKLLIEGYEYKEIADIHGMKHNGVKTSIQRIYKTLGVNNKIALIKFFEEKDV